jgi:hypothetical protein
MTVKRPRGGQTVYNREIADKILERLREGEGLNTICRDPDMPSGSAVRGWALDDRDGFGARYARAREIGALAMADDILEIADDARNDWMEKHGEDGVAYVLNGEHVARTKLRIDTRKWMLSKVLPKIFGDRVDHTMTIEKLERVEVALVEAPRRMKDVTPPEAASAKER